MTLDEKVDLLLIKQEDLSISVKLLEKNVQILEKRLFGDREDESRIGFIADTSYRFKDLYVRVCELENVNKKRSSVKEKYMGIIVSAAVSILIGVAVFLINTKAIG